MPSQTFPLAARDPAGHLQYIGMFPAPDKATAVALGRVVLGDASIPVEILGETQPHAWDVAQPITPAMLRKARSRLVAELRASVDALAAEAKARAA